MKLLERHFEMAVETPDGIKKLRELILTLAMQGKLVPQDPNDQPASELLKEIETEKKKLIKEGKIKKQEHLSPIKPEMIPYELPKAWKWVYLSDISLRIHYGYTASANSNLDEVRLLRITDIQDNKVDWQNVPGCEIKEKEIEQYKLTQNDILIARTGGTVGKSFLVENINICAVFASYLIRVIPSKKYEVKYLKKFIESPYYWGQLYAKCSGTGQPNVNGTSLSSLLVPLPPLNEQKRIVAKIDQLMALCDKLEAERNERNKKRLTINTAAINRLLSSSNKTDFNNSWSFITKNFNELYSIPENVEELKKAILQLAVKGKLVSQDPNDQPASELLKEIEAEKKKLIKEGKIKKQELLSPIKQEEIPYKVPKGWEWVRLGSILSKFGAGSTPLGGSKVYQDTGIMFLRSQNIWNDGLKIDDVAKINEIIHNKMSGTKVLGNDVLLNITGASIGRSTVYPVNYEEANVSQHVAILRSYNMDIVAYLHKCIISPLFQNMIMYNQVGVSREGLSMNKLKSFLIPVPPLAEQIRIVVKVDQLTDLCNTLEQQINDSAEKQTVILNAVLANI